MQTPLHNVLYDKTGTLRMYVGLDWSCPVQTVNMTDKQRAHGCLPHISLSTGPIRTSSYTKAYQCLQTLMAQKGHHTVYLQPEQGPAGESWFCASASYAVLPS